MTQLAAYISQLNPMEQKVLQIAASHLETSFSLAKSIGFQEWQAEERKKQAQAVQAPAQRKIKMKKKLTPKNRSKLAPTLL